MLFSTLSFNLCQMNILMETLTKTAAMTIEKSEDNFNTIILLTDFSKDARNAMSYAVDAFGSDVNYKIINAYYARTSSATLLDINDILAKESKQGLEKDEAWLRKEHPGLFLKLESKSVFGTPVDAIKGLAKDKCNDLLVMGTKGSSGIDSVLFGSVASTIIKTTVIPVLAVPPKFKFDGFSELVFASDGHTNYKQATLSPVKKIQKMFNSHVNIVTVGVAESDFDFNELELDNMNHSTIEDNNIAESVTNYCFSKNADLLVLVPQHNNFFSRLFHKSISLELVQQAQMPILALEVK